MNTFFSLYNVKRLLVACGWGDLEENAVEVQLGDEEIPFVETPA